MRQLSLSVVIIGRNEEENIERCIESVLKALKNYTGCEVLYIDSNSSDNTISKAQKYNIVIYCINPNEQMSASKGRYVGAKNSSKDYILFLDADMELFDNWLDEAINILEQTPNAAGIIGMRNDLFSSNGKIEKKKLNCCGVTKLQTSRNFGGAVLFKRCDLLEAGNFSPNIIANEEAELYSRLLHCGKIIIEHPANMINHYRPMAKAYNNIIRILLSKRNLGVGQGTSNAIYSKTLFSFIKKFNCFFAGLLIDIVTIALFVSFMVQPARIPLILAFTLQTILFIYTSAKQKWYFYILNKIYMACFLPGMLSFKQQKEVKYTGIQENRALANQFEYL